MKKTSLKCTILIAIYFILFNMTVNIFTQNISWELTNGPKDSIGAYLSIYSLGSTKNGNIFAGTDRAGVCKSSDMGATWINCSSSDLINSAITYMVIDTNDIIYVTSSEGVFKSTDHGNNWIKLTTGLPSSGFQSVAAGNSGQVFAGSAGIFRSLNYGSSWSFSGLDSCFVWVIKILNDSIVVAGTFNYGLFISIDKGENWESINYELNQIVGLAISSTGNIFAGVTGGIHRSVDWGKNWEQVLTTSPVWVGVIFLFQDQLMFGGSGGEGIFVSSDNGENWNNINSGLETLYINAFCGSNNGLLYAGSDSGVYRTSDPILSNKSGPNYLPRDYCLYQNYPNPFNPITKIRYSIPNVQTHGYASVRLEIFDLLGRMIAILVNKKQRPGNYEVAFDGSKLASGVYLYRLIANINIITKKMIILK